MSVLSVFGRPFVKRFTLCYGTVVCPVCLSVTLVYCAKRLDGSRWNLAGLGPGHIVLDGDPAPPPQKGRSPRQFSAHVCCGQTAGWIKMPLGTDVGLDSGDIMLDEDHAPPRKTGEQHPPILAHVYCYQTVGWIKMKLGMEV